MSRSAAAQPVSAVVEVDKSGVFPKRTLAWSFWIRFVGVYGAWMFPRVPLFDVAPDRSTVYKWIQGHALSPLHLDVLARLIPDHEFGDRLEVAILGALLWLVIDSHRRNEPRAYEISWALIRFGCGASLMGWGLWKVFPMQLGYPRAVQLLSPLDVRASPAWILMWFNGELTTASQIFLGCVETGIALLLFFRKTAVLGAMALVLAMTGLFLMESDTLGFFGEQPNASNLIAMPWIVGGLLFLSFHWRSVLDFFLGRAAVLPALPGGKRQLAMLAFALFIVVANLFILRRPHQWIRQAYPAPLEGTYEVETYTRNGAVLPPEAAAERWQWVGLVESSPWKAKPANASSMCYSVVIHTVADSVQHLSPRYENAETSTNVCARPASARSGVLEVAPSREPGDTTHVLFAYIRTSPTELDVTTTMNGDRIAVHLRMIAEHAMPLLRDIR